MNLGFLHVINFGFLHVINLGFHHLMNFGFLHPNYRSFGFLPASYARCDNRNPNRHYPKT